MRPTSAGPARPHPDNKVPERTRTTEEERFTGNPDNIGATRISLHWNPTESFQGIAFRRRSLETFLRREADSLVGSRLPQVRNRVDLQNPLDTAWAQYLVQAFAEFPGIGISRR